MMNKLDRPSDNQAQEEFRARVHLESPAELERRMTDRFVVWLTEDGKWHTSAHWYAFDGWQDKEGVQHSATIDDAQKVARLPRVVCSFAVKSRNRYQAIKKARAMLDSRSLSQ